MFEQDPTVERLGTRQLFSIDVDDLILANADFFEEEVPSLHRSDLERETIASLDLLQQEDVRATFFVNAQYCADYSDLVHEIVRRGHSIASHGFRHRNVARIGPQEFERDLCTSLEALSRFQDPIIGYRPPAFSMPYEPEYLDTLKQNGIRYVSSGVGVARSNAPRGNHPVVLDNGLIHVPISTVHLPASIKYPIGYGVTSRLMPAWVYMVTLQLWKRANSYFHYYCHSFEMGGMSYRGRLPYRSRAARASTRIYLIRCARRDPLFRNILSSFAFQPIEDCF